MNENLENAVPEKEPESEVPEQKPEIGTPEPKSYQKVVEYVNQGIQERKLKTGCRRSGSLRRSWTSAAILSVRGSG